MGLGGARFVASSFAEFGTKASAREQTSAIVVEERKHYDWELAGEAMLISLERFSLREVLAGRKRGAWAWIAFRTFSNDPCCTGGQNILTMDGYDIQVEVRTTDKSSIFWL